MGIVAYRHLRHYPQAHGIDNGKRVVTLRQHEQRYRGTALRMHNARRTEEGAHNNGAGRGADKNSHPASLPPIREPWK